MKKLTTLLFAVVLIFVFTGPVNALNGYEIPNLNDYVFKYEDGVLYYSDKNDYNFSVYGHQYQFLPSFDSLSLKDQQTILSILGLKEYNWDEAIPGPLMRELLRQEFEFESGL